MSTAFQLLFFLIPVLVLALLGVGVLVLFKFTKVEEGTAKIILRFASFKGIIMAYSGYTFDSEWNIVPGKDKSSLPLPGGLRLIGFRLIDEIAKFKTQSTEVRLEDGQQRIVANEALLDYVSVRPQVFATTVRANTSERFEVTVHFRVQTIVCNPYKARFTAQNANAVIAMMVAAGLRRWIASKTADDLLNASGDSSLSQGSILWNEFDPDKLRKYRDEYGIALVEEGVSILKIIFPPKIAEALSSVAVAKLKAKAFAEETAGAVVNALARRLGKTKKEIQAMLAQDPNAHSQFQKEAFDYLSASMAAEHGSLVRIDMGKGGGFEGLIAAALAVVQGISNMKRG